MTAKRERCTVTTLIDGEIIEVKTSKILVHRCDECNEIIRNYDAEIVAAHCQICNRELCKEHRIPAPYANANSWETKDRYICPICNKTYANDLKNLELAYEAVRTAKVGHKACCDAGDEVMKTLRRKFWKNQVESQSGETGIFRLMG